VKFGPGARLGQLHAGFYPIAAELGVSPIKLGNLYGISVYKRHLLDFYKFSGFVGSSSVG